MTMVAKGTVDNKLMEVGWRIREMREIVGYTAEQMAALTDTPLEEYLAYEAGAQDFPFTFVHKCALAFNLEITDILEGQSAKLSTYTVLRKGHGPTTAQEEHHEIQSLAPMFRDKLAEPYLAQYHYAQSQQDAPIDLVTHAGQEFDYVLSGTLKVQVDGNVEILQQGDSIYYNSSRPHGMVAVGEEGCTFIAVVIHGAEAPAAAAKAVLPAAPERDTQQLIYHEFVDVVEDEKGALQSIKFLGADSFNFAYDVVDALAEKCPDKPAMVHLDRDKNERKFTFRQMKRESSRVANYFKSLGIGRGDHVMLVLKRHHQFWPAILALHKLGAVAVPATNLLMEHDFVYRFNAAEIKAVVCTADGSVAAEVEKALGASPTVSTLIMAGGQREGWRDFDGEAKMYSSSFPRPEEGEAPAGDDPMLMFFTSGTTGYPKIATHSYKYPLGHFITAKYWQCVNPDGVHFTISDTGWGKALWGKLYGQWLCEAAVFTYDFDRFAADDILPLFKQYGITTFCAPPTMYRMFIKEDLAKYDLSTLEHVTIAGEALNPEVFKQFESATGLQIMEGFGQTEMTLLIANLAGRPHKLGSMGLPSPMYEVELMDRDGNFVEDGENGEIVVRAGNELPCGLFSGYYRDADKTGECWYDGYYHTGDLAWRDEDGFFWYVGRTDDVIKSSGYRIGPFEIESVIMELPYVLECGVCGVPDEVRGQVVKACVVLTAGTEPTDQLKADLQDYVKKHTAPYKYPRIVEFRTELPKTISGKIQRNKL